MLLYICYLSVCLTFIDFSSILGCNCHALVAEEASYLLAIDCWAKIEGPKNFILLVIPCVQRVFAWILFQQLEVMLVVVQPIHQALELVFGLLRCQFDGYLLCLRI